MNSRAKPAVDHRRIKSKTCTVDGIEFASETEGHFYCYLKRKKERGEISKIECQPKFVLQPECTRFGRKYRPIHYVADFLVTYSDGHQVVYDVKGYSMEDAELKRKMFVFQHPDLELRWVAASKKYSETGWIEYDDLKRCRMAARKTAKENKTSSPLRR